MSDSLWPHESQHARSPCPLFLVFVMNFVPLRTQSSVPIFTWEQDYWLDCSLLLYTLLFSPPGRLYLLPPPSLLNSVNLLMCSRRWRTLRKLITGWICLSPFDSPLYPPSHQCLLPPSSLLYVTQWTSLTVSDWGEYIGNWLLATLLSPLLSPTHLILVTSISLLPLLFSNSVNLSGCPSLWKNFSSLT